MSQQGNVLQPQTALTNMWKCLAFRPAEVGHCPGGLLGIYTFPFGKTPTATSRRFRKRNAPAESSAILPFTCRSRLGNAPETWSRRLPPRRNGQRRKGEALCAEPQESDRTASPALSQDEVCSRAVLPGGDCPEHQATGPLPQPTD